MCRAEWETCGELSEAEIDVSIYDQKHRPPEHDTENPSNSQLIQTKKHRIEIINEDGTVTKKRSYVDLDNIKEKTSEAVSKTKETAQNTWKKAQDKIDGLKKKKNDDSVAEEVAEEVKDAAEDIKDTVADAVEDIAKEVKED